MIRYLLDTDVLSEPVKAAPDPGVVRYLRREAERSCTAALVWSELMYGAMRLPEGRRRRRLAAYLKQVRRSFPILPFGREAAEILAHARSVEGRVGRHRPKYDAIIAATAAQANLILVTGNVGDFQGFPGLRVERWHS